MRYFHDGSSGLFISRVMSSKLEREDRKIVAKIGCVNN